MYVIKITSPHFLLGRYYCNLCGFSRLILDLDAGKYGINDVKQALRELNERQINSYALAIEAQAKYYLPRMFGQNHYQILTTPVELLQSMVKLYEKIRH